MSWRYLWPGQDERIRLHRRWWWDNRGTAPRAAWLLLELWLWLRWCLWDGWRASWRAVYALGPEVQTREGFSLASQRRRTLALTLRWCIPPVDVYRFRLYSRPAAALDYVFDHELPAYHRWRSGPLGLRASSLALLQDKKALADELGTRGISVVPTLACVPRHSRGPLLSQIGGGMVFCKTRSGNAGFGAFAAWRTHEGMEGRTFHGEALADSVAVERAWESLVALDDALIQPCLTNHPALSALASGDEVVTVRFITQWRDGTLACLSATLEVPAGRADQSGLTSYAILPVDAATGRLAPSPETALLTRDARERAARVWALVTPDDPLPHWARLVDASYRAHETFQDVWAIAWDWVIALEGPVLLEGNSGWSTVTPQLLGGGLVRRGDA